MSVSSKRATISLNDFIAYRLSLASDVVSDLISEAYGHPFGLTVPEWRLVAVLAGKGTSNQSTLGRITRMDKVTVSRAARSLMRRGLISQSPNPADGRSHLLELTNSGQALFDEVAPRTVALEKELLADFSGEEVDMLMKMLVRLEKAAAATSIR